MVKPATVYREPPMFNAWSTTLLVAYGMMQVKYVNDRQQVVYIINGQRTVEQGPFTKIIWPSTRLCWQMAIEMWDNIGQWYWEMLHLRTCLVEMVI